MPSLPDAGYAVAFVQDSSQNGEWMGITPPPPTNFFPMDQAGYSF